MTGGASRTARLQYLSAPEPGGHQPRNRHEVNDPLLLALQKELTSNLLWVLVFLLLQQQSAQWAPKRMGRCPNVPTGSVIRATWRTCRGEAKTEKHHNARACLKRTAAT